MIGRFCGIEESSWPNTTVHPASPMDETDAASRSVATAKTMLWTRAVTCTGANHDAVQPRASQRRKTWRWRESDMECSFLIAAKGTPDCARHGRFSLHGTLVLNVESVQLIVHGRLRNEKSNKFRMDRLAAGLSLTHGTLHGLEVSSMVLSRLRFVSMNVRA